MGFPPPENKWNALVEACKKHVQIGAGMPLPALFDKIWRSEVFKRIPPASFGVCPHSVALCLALPPCDAAIARDQKQSGQIKHTTNAIQVLAKRQADAPKLKVDSPCRALADHAGTRLGSKGCDRVADSDVGMLIVYISLLCCVRSRYPAKPDERRLRG